MVCRHRRFPWCLVAFFHLFISGRGSTTHREMFSCTSSRIRCSIIELNEDNWFQFLDTKPHMVMLYAPWCASCKKIVPTLKSVAKSVKQAGLAIGAVNVERSPSLQWEFQPTAFPMFLFCPTSDASECVEYRDATEDAMAQWVLETAVDTLILIDEKHDVAQKSWQLLKSFRGYNKPTTGGKSSHTAEF